MDTNPRVNQSAGGVSVSANGYASGAATARMPAPASVPSVLIVDDEEGVLELTALYLRSRGLVTMQQTSVQSAAQRFEQARGSVDLLIADVCLPDGSGVELGVRLHGLKPRLKFLFVSGYSLEDWNRVDVTLLEKLPPDSVRILGKPFSSRDLLAKAAELIGPPPAPPLAPVAAQDHESAERLRVITALELQSELLELSHDAIMVRDLEGRIKFWNRGAETLYSWPRDRAIGSLSNELLLTVYPEPLLNIEKTLKETGRWQGELRHTLRDGSTIVVSSRWAVRDGLDGRSEILEVNRDITPYKEMEAGLRSLNKSVASTVDELRLSEARFRGLLESAPDATVIVNIDGEIILVNARTEELFGYTRDELVGQSIDMLAPRRFRTRYAEVRADCASKPRLRPKGPGRDLFGLRKNGEEFPVEIVLSALKTASGVLISSSIRDVSEREWFENELLRKNILLENADKAKDLFLDTMSHELRAPLHTVSGFANLLAEERKGPLTKDQKRYIGYIQADSQHLMNLVNDLLDLSKIKVGALQLAWETFDAAGAIEEVAEAVRSQVEEKAVRLETTVYEPVMLHADYVRFKQVLYNLLSNAIKFTPALGKIRVDAARRDGFIEIAVHDSGIGIPKDEQESVFEKFYQSGSTAGAGSQRKRHQGTGLGLAITRALVAQHGGRIWLESEQNKGSCFIFTMPASPAQDSVAAAGRTTTA